MWPKHVWMQLNVYECFVERLLDRIASMITVRSENFDFSEQPQFYLKLLFMTKLILKLMSCNKQFETNLDLR